MELENKNFSVKWNKQTFTFNSTRTTIGGLKEDLQGLTNVLPGRQKLLLKGRILKDEEDISAIPEKAQLTLLGTAEAHVVVTTHNSNVVFLEELTKEDKIRILKEKGEEVMFGLKNLGNTCYFNSLIQACGRVEPLRKALISMSQKNQSSYDLNKAFLFELGKVYSVIDNATDTVVPMKLVNQLRALNPSFAEQDKGYYKQQDADECLSLMINAFKSLKNETEGEKYSDNMADELFGISVDISMTNVEDNTEIKTSKDTAYKLICYIDNNTSELVTGLKNGLSENVDLYSEKLFRNTVFIKKQLISRLPPFLNIQFMRFFWKQAVEDMQDSKAGKAKILKSVMFSNSIDIYDFCTPDVQEILKLGRDIETKMLKDDKDYRSDLSCIKKGENMIPTGRYQLISVVTHQGRSSESGHYIGWAHKKKDNWVKYDDDVVSYVKTPNILELKGGGDWHMAYICIYQAMEVPFQEL